MDERGTTPPGAAEHPSPRHLMDEHYTAAVQLLAERHGLTLYEAWDASSRTHAFDQLRHKSTGLYQKSPEELYEIFRQELGL